MLVSEVEDLEDVIGKTVRVTTKIAGVPSGTEGKVVRYGYNSEPYTRGTALQWIVVDWFTRVIPPVMNVFTRGSDSDETVQLELV